MKDERTKNICLALISALVYILLFKAIGLIIRKLFSEPDASFLPQLIIDLIGAVIGIIFLTVSKKTALLKAEKGSFSKGIGAGAYQIAVVLLSVAVNIMQFSGRQLKPLHEIVLFILLMLLVGVSEEIIYRGVVFDYFHTAFGSDTKSGAYLTAAFSGTVFGAAHLFNLIGSKAPAAIFFQAIGTAAVGFFYAAVYLRCRNLWVTILLHALSDFSAMLADGFLAGGSIRHAIDSHSIRVIIGTAIYIGVGIFLLRAEKMSYRPEPDARKAVSGS